MKKNIINTEEKKKNLKIILTRFIFGPFYTLCSLIVIINLFVSILTSENTFSYNSYITLKINKKGNIKIIRSYDSFIFPFLIQINGINQSNNDSFQYFESTENTVKLFWENHLRSTSHMFYGCSDIVEIDLSHFDSSHVTDMSRMFEECSSLISLDLSNFNTSLIESLYYMFSGCSSLISINLYHFDTLFFFNLNRFISFEYT